MNIFSDNVINDYSFENPFKGESYDYNKLYRKMTKEQHEIQFKRKPSNYLFIDSDSIVDNLNSNNNNSNKNTNPKFIDEEMQIDNLNQMNTSKFSVDNNINSNNKNTNDYKNINNNINTSIKKFFPKNNNDSLDNYYYNTSNLEKIDDKRNKMHSLSPREMRKYLLKETDIKRRINLSIVNSKNDFTNQKLSKFRNNSISNSHVGFKCNLLKKLIQENSRKNSFEINDKSSFLYKDSTISFNNCKKAAALAAYITMNPIKIISDEEKNLRRASYLIENQLVTIKEDNEIPQVPKHKILNEIMENNSEFNEDILYEKNQNLNCEEFANVGLIQNDSNNNNNYYNRGNYNDLIEDEANNNISDNNQIRYKHLNNHLMSNIEEIIKEDISDSFNEDSKSSSNSDSKEISNKKSLRKNQNEEEKNLKNLYNENKESLKIEMKLKSQKNSQKINKENKVRRINSIVSSKNRVNELTFKEYSKSDTNANIFLKKSNSYIDDSKNIKSLKFISNIYSNDVNKNKLDKNMNSLEYQNDLEKKFNNKEQKFLTIGISNRNNIYNTSNNKDLDSFAISESISELKSLETEKKQKTSDSNSNDCNKLNYNNGNEEDKTFKFDKYKNEIKNDNFGKSVNGNGKEKEYVSYNDKIDLNYINHPLNKNDFQNKHFDDFVENKIKRENVDELDIKNLIKNNNSSEDDSD
jgi:hypothetical protein